jgi:hypothetical protein
MLVWAVLTKEDRRRALGSEPRRLEEADQSVERLVHSSFSGKVAFIQSELWTLPNRDAASLLR